MGSEAGQRQVADVDAVDEHSAAVHVVEAREQSGHGGLPASGPTHDGHRLTGFDHEVEAFKDGRRLLSVGPGIPEGDVPELDPSPGVDQGSGTGPVDDRRLFVQDLVDSQRRGRRPLGLEEHEAEHPERD